jgi:hypothetical protein
MFRVHPLIGGTCATWRRCPPHPAQAGDRAPYRHPTSSSGRREARPRGTTAAPPVRLPHKPASRTGPSGGRPRRARSQPSHAHESDSAQRCDPGAPRSSWSRNGDGPVAVARNCASRPRCHHTTLLRCHPPPGHRLGAARSPLASLPLALGGTSRAPAGRPENQRRVRRPRRQPTRGPRRRSLGTPAGPPSHAAGPRRGRSREHAPTRSPSRRRRGSSPHPPFARIDGRCGRL